MTSQRSRFLASLGERLQSDLALREQDRDDETAAPSPEHTGQPRVGDEAAQEEFAGERTGGAPAARAAQAERGPGDEAVAPPDVTAPIDPYMGSEGERAPRPSVPWSEIGLPLRLREAIASVRRVSHDMHEAPDDDYASHGPVPFGDRSGYDDYAFGDDATYQEPPPDEPRRSDEALEEGQARFGVHAPYEQPPPDHDYPALLDEDADFQRERMRRDDDAAHQEPTAHDELVLLDDGVVEEERHTSFSGRVAYDEPPPGDELIPLDEGAAYPHEWTGLDEEAGYQERSAGGEAAREQIFLDEEPAQDSEQGALEAPHDRQPPWRERTTRYGLHAAAFAVAIAFVALAGFGLGILSGGEEVEAPLARDAARAAPTEAAPRATGQQALRAESEQRGELSDLVTVRVAPAPVAAVPEPAPAARVSTSALPLPPPPKPALRQADTGPALRQAETSPALRQADTGEAAPPDRQLAGAVDDAAAALLEAEGTGGPFQPLFTKFPAPRATETRVFVHYSASAVGAPATAMHLVRHLKAEGFAVEARPVEFSIPTNSIRYFFAADRERAEALRSSLEGQIPGDAALTVMDFTSYEPRPRPGLIEIWLRA